MTYTLGSLIGVKVVPRRYSKTSSDPDFLAFLQNDPLFNAAVPLQWVGALYEWERSIRQITPLAQEVLILQGTADTVVNAAYNIRFLQEKLTGARVQWIPDARHHLVNERPDLRNEILQMVTAYLIED
jgi:alpha-beta hydrolase superfamily lysophospholipase